MSVRNQPKQPVDVGVLSAALRSHPVIAAVRTDDGMSAALDSPVKVIFLVATAISRLAAVSAAVRDAGKLLFVHLDFVEGLAKDEAGMEYLVQTAHPTGLITTRTGLVQAARRSGVVPVQRLFLIDSQSVGTGIESARSSKAEVVEVLPGIAPRAVAAVRSQLPNAVIITGGLIRTAKEVTRVLAAGASGVSTSSTALWATDPRDLMPPDGGQA